MRKLTSAAEARADAAPLRVVLLTMDNHLASATLRAASAMRKDLPGVGVEMHSAAEWSASPAALERAHAAIATGDIIIVTMLFLEDHFLPVLDALKSRRDHCDALVCAMSAAEVTRLTRMGGFQMDGSQKGALSFLKRLKPKKAEGGRMTAGAEQMRMLRRIPKLLRFVPGTAQDVRAYFLTLQYWLAGSDDNVNNLIRFLIGRYAAGPRAVWRALAHAAPPVEYPDTGLYHPRAAARITDRVEAIPSPPGPINGTVGLIVLRSYVLAGNASHYDGVIAALEARGLRVLPAFASGLDSRPAIDAFFWPTACLASTHSCR